MPPFQALISHIFLLRSVHKLFKKGDEVRRDSGNIDFPERILL